jgi:ribose 5-phosphate isomerase A
MTIDINELKKLAAVAAVDEVQSGIVVGLGSGSTATFMIQEIGERLRDGRLHSIVAVPTSEKSAKQAQSFAIPLASLEEQPAIDLTIDGADEIDPHLDLIKGLGGSLLREKIIASVSKRMIVISDHRKLVERLGMRAPLPVEVIPFARRPVDNFLRSLGSQPVMRQKDGQIFITDEGNIILDCHFAEIANPAELGQIIIAQPGVVEHGFFLGMATEAIVATETGIERFARK